MTKPEGTSDTAAKPVEVTVSRPGRLLFAIGETWQDPGGNTFTVTAFSVDGRAKLRLTNGRSILLRRPPEGWRWI